MTGERTREAPLAARRSASPQNAGMRRYAVKAVWRTLQGEGAWAGRPAVFVRLAGCNLWTGEDADRDRDAKRSGASCPRWCDTDFRKAGAVKLTAADLIEEIRRVADGEEPIRFVVLTGGEPFLQADAALVQALREAGFFIACETNGTCTLAETFAEPVTGDLIAPDWIVCSPKLPADQLVLEAMDELKLVVPDYLPSVYQLLVDRVQTHTLGGRSLRYLWLQPEDGPRLAEAKRLAVELALGHPEWRVSVQAHKHLGVD